MQRRTFVKAGLLTSIGISKSHGTANAPLPDLLRSNMIWTRESIPVPVNQEAKSADIAGIKKNSTAADLHAVFLKELILPLAPHHAELHLFSYTRYRLYVNGTYIGRGPSRFQNQRPEYDTRDVTNALQSGRNVIAVLVHRDAPTGRIMHHEPGFTAVLEWNAKSGAHKIFTTHESWRSRAELSFGARDTAWSSIRESIDARKMADWTSLKYDASDWPPSVRLPAASSFPLYPRTTPLQSETLRAFTSTSNALPVKLHAPSEITFELPQLIQGYHCLELDAQAGSELEVQYQLPENQESGTNIYVARAGPQTYIGGDTFAFNKLSIRLKTGAVTLTNAQVFEVRYPLERVGAFNCNDPFLNQLWSLSARSLEVLSEDAYVDCADRERVEWTDETPPAFGCTRVMMAGPKAGGGKQWSDARLLKALLRRIALTQQPDGQIKAHSCSERWDIHAIMEDRSCDWVIATREYFESTGDRGFVRELWPTMNRLMNWFLARRTPRGLILAREWEVWDNPIRYQVCEGAGLNAFVYHALRDAAHLGRVIGEGAQSAAFAAAAGQLATAFNLLLWDDQQGAYHAALFGPGSKMNPLLSGPVFTGPIVDGHYKATLQAQLFALDSGVVPVARINAVQQWVLSHQSEATGVMSCHFLIKALYAMDREQEDAQVLELLRTRWAPQVASPWATSWETLTDEGASKVHIYGMVPGYFLSAYLLGVRVDGPVSRRSILIEPRPGNLSGAEGVVVTEFGPVPVSWTRDEQGGMSLSFTVPEHSTASVRLRSQPAAPELVLNGRRQEAKKDGPYLVISVPAGRHLVLLRPRTAVR